MSENFNRRFWQAVLRVMIYMTPIFLISIVMAAYRGFSDGIMGYSILLLGWAVMVLVSAFFHTHNPKMRETLEKPLQFHFSTAIVLVLSASILLWLNMRNRSGWPFDLRVDKIQYWKGGKEVYESVNHLDFFCLFADVCVAFALLHLVAGICEFLIRREARKP